MRLIARTIRPFNAKQQLNYLEIKHNCSIHSAQIEELKPSLIPSHGTDLYCFVRSVLKRHKNLNILKCWGY